MCYPTSLQRIRRQSACAGFECPGWIRRRWCLGSVAFDPSIEQMALALAHGGSLVVMTDAVRESPPAFWDTLARHRVNLLTCTPSFLASVLGDAAGRLGPDHLALGGERLTAELCA